MTASNHSHYAGPSRPSRQRGAFAYLFALAVALAATSLLALQPAAERTAAREARDRDLLIDARQRVLAYLTTPQLPLSAADTGRRLADWRLWPDLPIAAGPGADAPEPVYDGMAETGGCAFRGWVPGQALQPVATSGAAARCFGQLPWRELGWNPGDVAAGADGNGQLPWVVVSPNLALGAACLPDLTPLLLGRAYVGHGCTGAPAWPWIRIVDGRGNPLTDRVAVALILPGPPVGGQVRTGAATPAQFLDRLTVLPQCRPPCVPGTYDNAGHGHPDGQPTVLVAGPRDDTTDDPSLASPRAFNDRLAWITIDELMLAAERVARRELLNQLQRYRAARGHYPWAAALNADTGACVAGLRLGHPPAAAGNCASGSPDLAAWFTDGGWHKYFVYAVSPRCVEGQAACDAPGLTVDADSDVDAVLIAPGSTVASAPYVPAKGGPQVPRQGLVAAPAATPADFVDHPVNAGAPLDVFTATAGLPAPQNDRLEVLR